MERKQKTIYQLDTPYTGVHWPLISSQNQETIFEILIRLLAPIGSHRAAWTMPSNGKRNRKRKRQEVKRKGSNVGLKESEAPPAPEISSHLLVGLSSITRHLELISSNRIVDGSHENSGSSGPIVSCGSGIDVEHDGKIKARHLAAVFVCRSSQPSVLHAHLPQLAATASLRNPNLQPTRLVQLPPGSEDRLSSALGLPRASFVAVMADAPHSKPLLDLVQELVPVIEVPWLEEARKAEYMPVKVNSILTTAPAGKLKLKKY